MTLELMKQRLLEYPGSHCDNAQCLKLLEIIVVLREGNLGHGLYTPENALSRAAELERSL